MSATFAKNSSPRPIRTDATVCNTTSKYISSNVMSLSTRPPRNHSSTSTHRYRRSDNIELEALREEAEQDLKSDLPTKATQSQSKSRSRAFTLSKYRINHTSPPSLKDSVVPFSSFSSLENNSTTALTERLETSRYLSFRIPSTTTPILSSEPFDNDIPQSLPRSRGVSAPIALRTESSTSTTSSRPGSSINKYATISGSSRPTSRRRGKLSEIYPDHLDSSDATTMQQLFSPPTRLPGASLPPLSAAPYGVNGCSPSGRRRSSSQPHLPGTSSETGSAHIRQPLNYLSTTLALSQPVSRASSFSHRSSVPHSPHPYPPTNTVLRPYRLMELLRTTMTSKSGGYITRRLYVPNEVWSQTGVKLSNLSEKIRVVEALSSGLEEIQMASQSFVLNKNNDGSNASFTFGYPGRDNLEQWLKKLDDWNAVCDSILTTFGRKLGVGEGFVTKKSGSEKVPFWVRSTNLDSLAVYVSALVKLFHLAQTLGEHTKELLPVIAQLPSPPGYTTPNTTPVPVELCRALELRLKRSSEFFSSVVLMFVMRDLYLLLDKYVRKGEKWLTE